MDKKGIPQIFHQYIKLLSHPPTNFSRAYTVLDKQTRQKRFLKVIPRSDPGEAQIHERLDHPNIVRLLKTFPWEEHDVLVMPLLSGGTLALQTNTNLRDAGEMMFQVLLAVDYLHSHGVLHGDISPNNIMLDRGVPHLIDFGAAEVLLDGQLATNTTGTGPCRASERAAGASSFPADIYSLGITFSLVLGDRHLRCSSGSLLPTNTFIDRCSSLKGLIGLMTKIEPSERLTAKQCLKHQFFHEVLEAQWITGHVNTTRGDDGGASKKQAGETSMHM
jgi:serine/threonine protein kinase